MNPLKKKQGRITLLCNGCGKLLDEHPMLCNTCIKKGPDMLKTLTVKVVKGQNQHSVAKFVNETIKPITGQASKPDVPQQ